MWFGASSPDREWPEMSVHVCVHIVSMFVCSQVSIMGNPLVTTQVTLVTVSCQFYFFLKIFSVHQYHLGRLLGGWIRDCLSRLIPQVLLTLMMLLLTAWIFSLCWFFFKGRHVWRPSSPYFLNLRLKMVKNAYPPSHHHDNPDHSDHLQHGES